ncbi:hypothetical protein NA8A_04693 [Nitratireductor indicus C115]|uniref:Uncharacterized protein n=1 Tax=Nitratireductor indicus C115 TaxID=1231190 RepID=K2NVE4_9HYPH|nr:hypothetical protein [Nitratireductor indicus]EKF43300.1 hypothetical protein NA8A_04693 [Nitratireductor indicus C115]SFQ10635.1 hypothetical protein SAMN05216176_101371 [Nitratireductor indicus]
MRVYSRRAFLLLPEGVLFCKGVKWAFGELLVKGETLRLKEDYPGDFFYRNLCDIQSFDGGEWFGRLEAMLDDNASFPIQECYQRDGCFNEEDVFLVFELDDLRCLRELIDKALDLSD